jgi:hypothetical protein
VSAHSTDNGWARTSRRLKIRAVLAFFPAIPIDAPNMGLPPTVSEPNQARFSSVAPPNKEDNQVRHPCARAFPVSGNSVLDVAFADFNSGSSLGSC